MVGQHEPSLLCTALLALGQAAQQRSTVCLQFDSIQSFLSRNPREVVIARIKKVCEDCCVYRWEPQALLGLLNARSSFIDTSCTNPSSCTLGASRGKLILLNNGIDDPSLTYLRFGSVFLTVQDDYSVSTN